MQTRKVASIVLTAVLFAWFFTLRPIFADPGVTELHQLKNAELHGKLRLACGKDLNKYPLFDTEYKLAANYLPILGLRALADADIYRKKNKTHIERFFYVKDLSGKFAAPYQTIICDIEVRSKGILGRELLAKGTLNDFDFYYKNDIKPSISKKAQMSATASIDGCEFMNLEINSDANSMTNNVQGSFFGLEVAYKTVWRQTEGLLAGTKYKIYTEGAKKNSLFEAFTYGSMGNSPIKGEAKEIQPGVYHTEESYGPVLVKTFITVSGLEK